MGQTTTSQPQPGATADHRPRPGRGTWRSAPVASTWMVKEPNPPGGTQRLRHSCHRAPPSEPSCACRTPSFPVAEPNGTGNLPHTDSNLITLSDWHRPAPSAHIAAVRCANDDLFQPGPAHADLFDLCGLTGLRSRCHGVDVRHERSIVRCTLTAVLLAEDAPGPGSVPSRSG